MTSLWPTIKLSLAVASMATLLAAAVALPLAYWLARHRAPGRSILETLVTIPLVLPPTVVGYGLLVILGQASPIGKMWHAMTGERSPLFTPYAAMLAAAVVALPLLFLPAKAAFATVERELEDIATLLGASRLQMFWHVSLPLARRGIASGLLLAFARALGEFGATIMVFGIQPRKQTLPISIYADYMGGEMNAALPAVIVLIVTSLVLIVIYNRSSLGSRE